MRDPGGITQIRGDFPEMWRKAIAGVNKTQAGGARLFLAQRLQTGLGREPPVGITAMGSPDVADFHAGIMPWTGLRVQGGRRKRRSEGRSAHLTQDQYECSKNGRYRQARGQAAQQAVPESVNDDVGADA